MKMVARLGLLVVVKYEMKMAQFADLQLQEEGLDAVKPTYTLG